jgi:2-oxoisovalerate dehydrogenase E1 component alpha subunit
MTPAKPPSEEAGMASQHKDTEGNGSAALAEMSVQTGRESLPASRCLEIYRIMVRTRFMEERMIKMSKSGEGYFWIGGPGEEGFNSCLGLQVKKGQGPAFDYLHLHYRNSATLVAMGMPVIDGLRQMAMTATDTHSRGRNFPGHFAHANWNIIPISSVIEVQYAMAPGTALVQRRHGGDGITIVTGGDAGTAEADFASCLIWSTRPGREVPLLIIVTNNGWGISTPATEVHAEQRIIDRGKAFGIPGEMVDGNDPVASWHALQRGISHCRTKRRPFMIEANVARLYGHSSSSGAPLDRSADDCIKMFEQKLLKRGILEPAEIERIREEARQEIVEAVEQIATEPRPTPDDINLHTYAPSSVDAVYPDDYTGLPPA